MARLADDLDACNPRRLQLVGVRHAVDREAMAGNRVRETAAIAILSLALPITTYVRPASAAAAQTILADAWLRDCSNTTTCQPFDTLRQGARVEMQCWKEESDAPGNGYWGKKWFLVKATDPASGFKSGYVHSSYVSSPQPVVPNCDVFTSERAVRWARNGVGWSDAYQYQCLRFVHEAYMYGGGVPNGIGQPLGDSVTAWQWWSTNASRQRADWNPPRGALVFFAPTGSAWPNNAGHVALSLGGRRAVTTLEGGQRNIHVMTIEGSATYRGWIWP
jgi:hypothetical protein